MSKHLGKVFIWCVDLKPQIKPMIQNIRRSTERKMWSQIITKSGYVKNILIFPKLKLFLFFMKHNMKSFEAMGFFQWNKSDIQITLDYRQINREAERAWLGKWAWMSPNVACKEWQPSENKGMKRPQIYARLKWRSSLSHYLQVTPEKGTRLW